MDKDKIYVIAVVGFFVFGIIVIALILNRPTKIETEIGPRGVDVKFNSGESDGASGKSDGG